uniref:Plasmodium RESA N-terminal domain-containing protein n=1 Tax=Panagrolaimus superbus TaxID=310955 RepID=A0A914YZB6_9BILA
MQEDNELGNNDRQKRLGYFPSRINSIYTEVRARPGLYGHDVALKEILHFKFLDNLNLTECEKGFYTLWNNFNAERSNRDYGTMALYKKLLKFIEKYYDTIVKMKLKTVWNVFLIYFKNNNIITEMEFFELSFFHRPPLKNKIAWK